MSTVMTNNPIYLRSGRELNVTQEPEKQMICGLMNKFDKVFHLSNCKFQDTTKESAQKQLICGLECEFNNGAKLQENKICGVKRKFENLEETGMYDSMKELEKQINSGFESNYDGLINSEHPVLAKLLTRSHVSCGKMNLHALFCRRHLPEEDSNIELETEIGELYEVKYLQHSTSLSGGWSRFVIDKKLKEGDLVLFQLVEAERFKVYCVRKDSEVMQVLHTRKDSSLINLPYLFNYLLAQEIQRAEDSKDLVVDKRAGESLLGSMNVARDKDEATEVEGNKVCELIGSSVEDTGMYDSMKELEKKINRGFQTNYEGLINLEHLVHARLLTRSNVSGWFKLDLYGPFCRRHMPEEDAIIELETEIGELYKAKYLRHSTMLSGGWRKFAISMNLKERDFVLFQLVEPKRFKVYCVRKDSKVMQVLHTRKDSSLINLPYLFNYLHAQERQRAEDSKDLIVYKRAGESVLGSMTVARDKEQVARMYEAMLILEKQMNCLLESNYDEGLFEHPALARILRRSFASGGFLLHLLAPFCRRHLPDEIAVYTLEMETGEEYEVKYLPRFPAFSGGWRRFAIDMKLKEGDLVVFKLVDPKTFKIYIARKDSSVINLSTLLKLLHVEDNQTFEGCDALLENIEAENKQIVERSEERVLDSKIHFSNITGFQDFQNVMCELLQDDMLPENSMQTYYKLCCKHNDFLHTHLVEGKHPRLFVEGFKRIILGTVNIATELETCDLSNFLEKFSYWDKNLICYEAAGMSISFLRARLHRLHTLAFNSEGASDRRSCIEACRERQQVEIQVKKLERILCVLRDASCLFATEVETLESKPGWEKYMEASSKLSCCNDEIREIEGLLVDFGKLFEHYDAHIESLKLKACEHEAQFNEEVNAPW